MGRREQFTVGELTLTGNTQKVGTITINILQKDAAGMILMATGLTVPTDATAGYAKGCLFIDTNVVTGTTGLYENVGTTASCNFDALGVPTVGELALATGSMLVGAAGLASAIDAKADGAILIGNGTTVAAQTLDTDVTMTNTGAVTIANNAITAVKINADAVTTSKIQDGAVTGAKWAAGAGVAAVLAAGLGGSLAITKVTAPADNVIVAAHPTKERACLVVATVTEAFAGAGDRTLITVGEVGALTKMWANTVFPSGLAINTVLVGAFTNTANTAITVSNVAAVAAGTGGVAITVIAIPTT